MHQSSDSEFTSDYDYYDHGPRSPIPTQHNNTINNNNNNNNNNTEQSLQRAYLLASDFNSNLLRERKGRPPYYFDPHTKTTQMINRNAFVVAGVLDQRFFGFTRYSPLETPVPNVSAQLLLKEREIRKNIMQQDSQQQQQRKSNTINNEGPQSQIPLPHHDHDLSSHIPNNVNNTNTNINVTITNTSNNNDLQINNNDGGEWTPYNRGKRNPRRTERIHSKYREDDERTVSRKICSPLPREATDLLRSWVLEHLDHPYPADEEKEEMASITGLPLYSINHWFCNMRRRSLVKWRSLYYNNKDIV